MRNSPFWGYTFGICAAVAILAGCGGSQMSIGQPTGVQSPTLVRASLSLNGEMFAAKAMQVKRNCQFGLGSVVEFSAKGTASGPVPGSFTAKGKAYEGMSFFDFHESFTIISGKQRVFGIANARKFVHAVCPIGKNGGDFEVDDAHYRQKGSQDHGLTSAILRKRFSQAFQ